MNSFALFIMCSVFLILRHKESDLFFVYYFNIPFAMVVSLLISISKDRILASQVVSSVLIFFGFFICIYPYISLFESTKHPFIFVFVGFLIILAYILDSIALKIKIKSMETINSEKAENIFKQTISSKNKTERVVFGKEDSN